MARPVVLSNGELHVGINEYGLVHDFYYPYVGLENHTIGKGLRHRIGVWVDGELSWLDDDTWQLDFSYPHEALIGHITARSEKMQIILEFDDAVDSEMSVLMRNIHVINFADHEREIRLFMHQAFVIGDSRSNTDTVRYMPDSNAVLHYRGRRVFIISGEYADHRPFDQYAVGLFGIEGHDGTWRDAEDGELSMSSVEHGRVDSVIRFQLAVGANSSERVHYWVTAGSSLRDALYIHKKVKEEGIVGREYKTAQWWYEWLAPVSAHLDAIPREYRRVFSESAMIIKAHIDRRGAVIASTDSAMLNYGRDAYAYTWPRDGAFVLWPLIRLGYRDEALRFFDFCRRGLHPAGYLQHKYRADGALGSSWHSYLHDSGIVAPPIQEDETAIVLFVFTQYYHMHASDKLLHEYYESFVRPMANFLRDYIDPATHLPKPTYDLWEEQFITSTYTVSVTYAALVAAAELAEVYGDADSAVAWRAAAEDMYAAAHERLYSTERKTLIKGLRYHTETDIRPQDTIDAASFFGAFMFGLFSADDPELESSVATIRERFAQYEGVGLPRYEDDVYRQVRPGQSNYWHISTLWLAQYLLEKGDEVEAKRILDWVTEHAYTTGVLAEQVVPDTGLSTSIAPLVWSQAEYMATILDLIGRGGTK